MRDPHVRFCERHGRAISRAYSTVADAGLEVGHQPRDHRDRRRPPNLIILSLARSRQKW